MGGFFPPNKSTPTPPSQLMETWPWSKYVGCPGRGGQRQLPHLLRGARIFSAASKSAASTLGNLGRGLLEATAAGRAQGRSREASTPHSQRGFVGWWFFLSPPKALKVLLYHHCVLPAITEGALDPSMGLSTGFWLWEASQTCREMGCSGTSCEV